MALTFLEATVGLIKATFILGMTLIAQTPQQYRIGEVKVTGIKHAASRFVHRDAAPAYGRVVRRS